MDLEVIPLISERKEGQFDISEVLEEIFVKNRLQIQESDVLVISTKFVSNSQGRMIELDKVRTAKDGQRIAVKFKMRTEFAEVVVRESETIFGGIPGFIITSSESIMAPNAGIDKSNTKKGKAILYPKDPYLVAEQIRRKIFLKYQIHVGVILIDSRLMPARVGTTGVAISCAGIKPILDIRSQKDLDGNPLKVTFQAIADSLATIANYKMGEGAESKPVVIIRNSGAELTDNKISPKEMTISYEQCVYVRGLANLLN